MSSDRALRVQGVSKHYQVRQGTAYLRTLLTRRSTELRRALTDVSFDVGTGEAVALLGSNGAGKSTLLRLLAGISRPTSGTIEVTGRVGALIEVWAGLHPELTGRQNILTYGRLLGLSRQQIAARFDAIVEFSELSHALDQQVKYYSSGMHLRLGFSIAAHNDPDVLLIDEALSVGDARFQRRCLHHIRSLLYSGTTLLYVSHDLRSVEAMCDRAVLLDEGHLVLDGDCREVLARHTDQSGDASSVLGQLDQSANLVTLEGATLLDLEGRPTIELDSDCGAEIELRFQGPEDLVGPQVAVGISQGGPLPLAVFSMAEHGSGPSLVPSRWACRLTIDELPLRAGNYELWVGVLGDDSLSDWFKWSHIMSFRVRRAAGSGRRGLTEVGPLALSHRFHVGPILA